MSLLKEKFVCVAVDARKERGEYHDADGDFVRATGCVTVTASGSVCVVTASGKTLGPYGSPGSGMAKWLREQLAVWDKLPAAERAPGAVRVPTPDQVDPKRAALTLPNGALVVRVFNRHLGWNDDRSLRYVRASDYLPGSSRTDIERYGMAQNDFFWITAAEWKALIPSAPTLGQAVELPPSLVLRLYRFHLDPCRGFTEGTAFTRTKADAGRMSLTVDAVTPEKVTLRLAGHVKLREPGRHGDATFEPALAGVIEVDRTRSTITRFDLVALGTALNLPTDANGVITPRRGEYPLGISFELVPRPSSAEHLPPRGARDNVKAYLEPK